MGVEFVQSMPKCSRVQRAAAGHEKLGALHAVPGSALALSILRQLTFNTNRNHVVSDLQRNNQVISLIRAKQEIVLLA